MTEAITYDDPCTVNGEGTTLQAYRKTAWLDKDTYRDMAFDVGLYGEWTNPRNGDVVRAIQPSN